MKELMLFVVAGVLMGCSKDPAEKISQSEVKAVKEGRVRVRYCGLDSENCVTNYPQHVFMLTNSQAVIQDVILGQPWSKTKVLKNQDFMAMTYQNPKNNSKLTKMKIKRPKDNLFERFIYSFWSFILYLTGKRSILNKKIAKKTNGWT